MRTQFILFLLFFIALIMFAATNTTYEPILDNGQGVIDPDVYFQINQPPADLPEFESKLSAFIDYHKEKQSKVVFITVSYCAITVYQQRKRITLSFM